MCLLLWFPAAFGKLSADSEGFRQACGDFRHEFDGFRRCSAGFQLIVVRVVILGGSSGRFVVVLDSSTIIC